MAHLKAEALERKDTKYYLDIWKTIGTDLLNHYGEALYKSWFSKIRLCEVNNEGSSVLLSAPTNFIRDWIKSNYFDILSKLWLHYDSSVNSLDIITKDDSPDEIKTPPIFELIKAESSADNITANPFSNLDPRFTFENFVVGSPNQLAYAAALAVSESKGAVTETNPLFLYGGVGLGKTHLMHAIAWQVNKINPNRKVLYISAETFMCKFINALRNKDIMAFKDELRSVDVLMIDDIQFICGKDSTQAEFFHTFNAIVDSNRQMVISCDRSPSDLEKIEDRIKSRLGWGLVVDVHSTTYELRLGILQSKLEQMNITVPREVTEFLANKITSNVRELEGALNKVIAHSTLIGGEITLERTQDILRDLLRANEKIITIENIQRKVAERYNIRITDMYSSRRLRSVARPRQIAMYIAKTLTSKSFAEIGHNFGKKDHTTVMHAIKKIEELKSTDGDFREEVELLTRLLQS